MSSILEGFTLKLGLYNVKLKRNVFTSNLFYAIAALKVDWLMLAYILEKL